MQLYREYRGLREKLFAQLRRAHPNYPPLDLLGYAQTILDRVLFVAFAEDRDLLPKNTLAEAIAYRDKYNPKPIWHNLKIVFRWIDRRQQGSAVPGLQRRSLPVRRSDRSSGGLRRGLQGAREPRRL